MSAMSSVQSYTLPKTPIKQRSLDKVRKRLYSTPQVTPTNSPTSTEADSNLVTVNSHKGLLVKHIDNDEPRANQVGVLIKRTSAETQTIDVNTNSNETNINNPLPTLLYYTMINLFMTTTT